MVIASFPRRRTLGQISDLVGGVTSGFAKQVVSEAEPAVRRIVREERNRFAEALTGGVPFAAFAALAFVGTRYLIPDKASTAKAAGYATAALSAAVGGWWTFSKLSERPETPPSAAPSSAGPSIVDPVVQKAAQALVAEAEPRVRAIVDEERARLAGAAMKGLPFALGALAVFLTTSFLVRDENRIAKAVGYSGSALLLGAGAWTTLSGIRETGA
jgi:hypothetical protein